MRKLNYLVLAILLSLGVSAHGADRLVPSVYPTIQAAIDAAVNGDTVTIADGTYTGVGNRNIDFAGKAITVKSENGPNQCTIDCQDDGRPFYFQHDESSSAQVIGFTIINGSQALCDTGSPVFDNCIFDNNSGQSTGGVRCLWGSNPTILNCVFSGQSGKQGCQVYIAVNSKPIIKNCIFKGGNSTAIACKDGSDEGGSIPSCPTISNCLIYGIYATAPYHAPPAIWLEEAESATTVQNCVIAGNYSNRWAAGIWCTRTDATITNCTIVNNSSITPGGGIGCYDADPVINNCIIWGNQPPHGPQIVLMAGSNPSISYCDIQGGWPGEGNIDTDPCFVDVSDDDYHIRWFSNCINTGDPNYAAEPNETDLDGLPRIIGGRVDMGAYEFNHAPIANAGSNQTVYAWIDGKAEVKLDGSGSSDADRDTLSYKWTWTIDANTYEANSVSPTIELPVGVHTIQLVVNDGYADSAPDDVNVTVVAPLTGKLSIEPCVINRRSNQPHILAFIRLPAGIKRSDIDCNEPITLYPGGIEASRRWVIPCNDGGRPSTGIFAFFDKDTLMAAVPQNGNKELKVAGKLKSGQYFYGCDTVKIISLK